MKMKIKHKSFCCKYLFSRDLLKYLICIKFGGPFNYFAFQIVRSIVNLNIFPTSFALHCILNFRVLTRCNRRCSWIMAALPDLEQNVHIYLHAHAHTHTHTRIQPAQTAFCLFGSCIRFYSHSYCTYRQTPSNGNMQRRKYENQLHKHTTNARCFSQR